MSSIRLVKLWIWLAALASLAGWGLSAIGQLNAAGYAVFFLAAAALIWLGRSVTGWKIGARRWHLGKIFRRYRRPLPGAFAVLTLLIFLGGVLYPPTNHTAFTYRIPRILNWLTHEGWFWIHSPDCRINDRACGIEWLATPLLLFTRSDRGMFLLNFIPFLMLPGLFYSVCVRLGVRRRAAWSWMWLLPTGYVFLLQAGSAGNDTFPTVYLLAAVDFGLRAWTSRRRSDLWYAMLAAALLTGAKGSNLPLLLPCAILIFPLLWRVESPGRSQWRSAVSWAGILLLAAVISFLPTAILNAYYCGGDWTGANIEPAHMTVDNPLFGLCGNAFQFVVQNLIPPVFPQARWWNQNATAILPHRFVAAVENNFHTGFYQLGEIPTEDWAGLGFGVTVLLLLSIAAAWTVKVPANFAAEKASPLPRILRQGVLLTPWIALLAYCLKSGMDTAARLIGPYYVVLWPSLIYGAGHSLIVRRGWWRMASWLVMLIAFVVLILTPPRPLWPAQTILSAALKSNPDQPQLNRALKVYSVYAIRSDPLALLRPLLPPDLQTVGFLGTPDDIDISLWRPYFSRRVEHILLSDTAGQIRARGIQYAVVSGLHFTEKNASLDTWLQQAGATLLLTTNATVKVADGPQAWHIVKFN